jgi:hypothetical protein
MMTTASSEAMPNSSGWLKTIVKSCTRGI